MEEAVLVLKEGKRTDHQRGRSTKLFQRALQRDTSSPDEVTTLPLYPSLPAQLLCSTYTACSHLSFYNYIPKRGASLVAQMVKNLPAVQETWVPSLDWEDPLKEGRATNSSILAWRIPWTEEPGGLQSIGSHRVRHD